jgi:hypothetical protein
VVSSTIIGSHRSFNSFTENEQIGKRAQDNTREAGVLLVLPVCLLVFLAKSTFIVVFKCCDKPVVHPLSLEPTLKFITVNSRDVKTQYIALPHPTYFTPVMIQSVAVLLSRVPCSFRHGAGRGGEGEERQSQGELVAEAAAAEETGDSSRTVTADQGPGRGEG